MKCRKLHPPADDANTGSPLISAHNKYIEVNTREKASLGSRNDSKPTNGKNTQKTGVSVPNAQSVAFQHCLFRQCR
jgi:hypothetical protein